VASGNGSEAAPREAEEIVAHAKERAAQIVREAVATAASASASAGGTAAGGAVTRAAIAPFLKSEREFLQSLGGLVQGHAEEIKTMVLSLRAKTEPGIRAASTRPDPETADHGSGASAGRAEDREEPDPAERPSFAQPVVITEADDPVRDGGPEPVPAERPSGEHSLRDLFWGED
jgi:hypothetical protein